MFAVYFLLLVVPLVSAQVEAPGPCPVPHVQPDFNMQAYLGMWYDIAKIPISFLRGKCVTADYKMGKGNLFTGENSQVINGRRSFYTATVKVKQSGEKAKLETRCTSEVQSFSPYWVLYTDYKTYSIVYSCVNNYDTHQQFAWILSRKPYLDPKTILDAKRFLVSQGIYGDKMEETDQSCFSKAHSKN